eukprot:1141959-Pelagomonas_calceolata.AAC.3
MEARSKVKIKTEGTREGNGVRGETLNSITCGKTTGKGHGNKKATAVTIQYFQNQQTKWLGRMWQSCTRHKGPVELHQTRGPSGAA